MMRVVINSMFLHHYVDPDPRVKTFEKQGATEKRVTDCEMRDFGNSAYLHWRLMKVSCRICLLFFDG